LEERGEIFLSVRQHFLFGIFNIWDGYYLN
jgi:hypothetical protein